MNEQKTNKEIFEEAISCNYVFSIPDGMNQEPFGHEHVITNSVFYGVNKVEGCQFSLTGIPGESGFSCPHKWRKADACDIHWLCIFS